MFLNIIIHLDIYTINVREAIGRINECVVNTVFDG